MRPLSGTTSPESFTILLLRRLNGPINSVCSINSLSAATVFAQ